MKRNNTLPPLPKLKTVIIGSNAPGVALVKLLHFLEERCGAGVVAFIGHPLAEAVGRHSELVLNRGGKTTAQRFPRERYLGPLSYLLDIVLTLYFLLRARQRFDLCVTKDPHLTLLAILLRRLGLVRATVMWTFDYFPQRFQNRTLNALYLKVDAFCLTRSNYGWHMNPRMIEARKERGVRVKDEERQIIVPYTIDAQEIAPLPLEELEPDSLAYIGLLTQEYGFELILDALPLVVRERPHVKVTVTTYQSFPEAFRKRIQEEGLAGNFDILGYIEDEAEFSQILRRHRVGLAPYRPDPKTPKQYADASRVKTFLAKGLPVIVTTVPIIAREVEQAKAGLVISYEKGELARAILQLLGDEETYVRYRENALRLIAKYRSEAVFSGALERSGVAV